MRLEIVLVLIILLILVSYGRENFASQRERAEAINNWLRQGGGNYDNYMKYIDGTIVEYERIKSLLKREPNPNTDQIKKIL